MERCAIVLAAGEGKRMRSKRSKLVHEVAGKPLVRWVADALAEAGVTDSIYVVGHLREQVRAVLGDVPCAVQEAPLGVAHAVRQAAGFLEGRSGLVFVLDGDVPLLRGGTLEDLAARHEESGAAATILAARAPDPTGFARVVRGVDHGVVGIVEDADCTGAQRSIHEIDSGLYAFDVAALRGALGRLEAHDGGIGAAGEGTPGDGLSGLVALLVADGLPVDAHEAPFDEVRGVDDRVRLQEVSATLAHRICEAHMRAGVTVVDPATTWIDASVTIGQDTEIRPGCHLRGATAIGADCVVGPDTRLTDAVLEDACEVVSSIVVESRIGARAHLGPFTYVRPGSSIGPDCRIGDFVEVKNSTIGHHTNAAHLAYLGDADVGDNVNFGCGSITVNYDGSTKSRTFIGSGAFIGSNSNLVAPVRVEADAYVAAGSTVTADVPSFALAIGRARQENKEGWVLKKGRVRKRKG
jgi:bifunctional UDP-N-acetylglucosamine pyrophosphorylase / glucosamine-1-phosphate N-acetyltransferase